MNLQNRNNLILSLIAETQFDAYVQGYMAKAGAAAGASDNLLVEAEGAAMLQGPCRSGSRSAACLWTAPAERPAPNRPRPTVADEVATGHRGQCQLDPRDPAGHEQGYLEYRDCNRSPGRVRPTLPGHREGDRAADALRRQLA